MAMKIGVKEKLPKNPVSVKFPEPLRARVEHAAAQLNISVSDIIRLSVMSQLSVLEWRLLGSTTINMEAGASS